MNSDSVDTDTLVAVVSSLLDAEADLSTIIDALVDSEGDPQAAADRIKSSKKRKASKLDHWLQSPKNEKKPRETPKKTVSQSELMALLRQPAAGPSSKQLPPRLPPLTLSNPELVAKHTPCTLHPSVLPPELAARLFYTMHELSRNWKRNEWFLVNRVVQSPHSTCFYVRNAEYGTWDDAARFWYNGRVTDSPATFPAPMEEACQIIERVVNQEISKRPRLLLEWGGQDPDDLAWRANVAAANCYKGSKESVGFHADQITYLGPYCTIASLSLGTRRTFSLREVIPQQEKESRRAQTFNIPLSHNSLIIMHAGCQESMKHSLCPSPSIDLWRPAFPPRAGAPIESFDTRINITFRYYRPDFRPSTIPKCKCDVPMILRADMKNRLDGKTDKYWWSCYAGAQNDGKTCGMWKLLDMEAEGRGPVIGDRGT